MTSDDVTPVSFLNVPLLLREAREDWQFEECRPLIVVAVGLSLAVWAMLLFGVGHVVARVLS